MRNFILLFTFAFNSALFSQQNLSSYVNPFIGTGGHGHTFPGAVLPFGMVQLSPDTRVDGSWDGCGGYHYSDSIIYGFSHTHLSGTGCSDYGDILVMPTVGEPSIDNKIYSSKFSHLKEKANAGFYEVRLEDDNIKAELTTTLRTGIHKYTFPKTVKANIILDLLHRDKTLDCGLKIIDSVTVSGFRISEAWAKEQYVFFVIRFSKPFKKIKFASAKKLKLELTETEKAEGAGFEFDVSDGKPLLIKVALSPTDANGALKNLEAEAKHWDFEKYKKEAADVWNKELNKIVITDSDKNKLSIFYTALYHCMIHPSINMDADGKYRGRDNKIHQANGFTYYSVFSLWDTFRGLHPLFTILEPKRVSDFINTFLYQYNESGRLPMWELSCNETDCMIGYHAVSVIADAFVKGIRGYDTVSIYESLKAAASYSGYGIPKHAKNGYLQIDDESESVSKTLEYAYDDWCIAQVAQKLNKLNDYNYFIRRAQSYKNVCDASSGFMRPRKNGGWLNPFDPKEVNNNYTEANSWQYSFFVPQDIDGLIAMYGGDKKFEEKLDNLFTTNPTTTGREQADITGLIGQYAHGNEPSHHMAYLYNYIGKPQKTIERVHQVLNNFYKNSPDGLIGNEDCGQMSAWYVLSAMGFYQVCPGTTEYVLGAPFFSNLKINLENGKIFEITSPKINLNKGSDFVNGVTLNSKIILSAYIAHQNITNGGNLVFNFTSKNDTANKYGINKINRPRTSINNNILIPVPVIISESKSFKNKQPIEIQTGSTLNLNLVYTIDGTEPTKSSPLYTKPFFIDSSSIIKAKNYSKTDSSKTTTGNFYKINNDWKISIKSVYSKQYSAGGDQALMDGVYGDADWRKGDWQGYQAQNFECVIDLGKIKEIKKVSSNYVQDTKSWIIFPTEVEYFVSNDGKQFISLGKIENTIKADDYKIQIKNFELNLKTASLGKFIKVIAKNFGKLPSWHIGAGGDAYIFIDEINVK